MKQFFLVLLLASLAFAAQAQFTAKGLVLDAVGLPIAGVSVSVDGTNVSVLTADDGTFVLSGIKDPNATLVLFKEGYVSYRMEVYFGDETEKDFGKVIMGDAERDDEDIPTVTLSDSDLDAEGQYDNVSGLLTASRDVFTNATAFNFSVARFRPRGLDGSHNPVLLNGVQMNDLETGFAYWGAWGGLNDVFRNRSSAVGLSPTDFAFGGLNGAMHIDIGAGSQWKQLRASYASSNRSYDHRLMATYSTGTMEDGTSISLSASRRWAQEGYVEGTFYDAYSYFFSIERKFNDSHSFSATLFGAPNKRGKQSASITELYELAGTNYYNPYWGYQEGEKRNSRVGNSHQPVGILQHKWKIADDMSLNTSFGFQFGRNGGTALDWTNARDPRPDYYRYLPSWAENEEIAQELYDAMKGNDDLLQLDWNYMYQANYDESSYFEQEDANGIAGNTVTGHRAKYIVEERRYDKKKADLALNFNKIFSDKFIMNAGFNFQMQTGHNHKRLVDLLGGDFFIDVDRFTERDFPDNEAALQNDLNTPNRVIREGDVFGFSYNPNIRKTQLWTQGQFSFSKIDAFIAAEVSNTRFWRTGNYVNGRFPDSSFGDSEKQSFFNYNVKGGLTYKINGRNFLFANGLYGTRAPSFRNAYVSPRTRDELAPGLTDEKIMSGEAGYMLKSPAVKARASAYFTRMLDGVRTLSFYHDVEQAFVNYTLNDIDKQHFGVELAVETKIFAGLSANAVASIGQYTYTNRPTAKITQDNSSEVLVSDRTIYQKNFYIPGTPQRAYSVGLRYNSSKFWFATVSFNVFDERYLDFNPDRRTSAAVDPIEYGTADWNEAIDQERLDLEYTLDFFGGKSFKIKNDYFIYLNVGVSNILNNRDFATGGYEQLRFEGTDIDRFPNRYYFAYGVNYFASITFRKR